MIFSLIYKKRWIYSLGVIFMIALFTGCKSSKKVKGTVDSGQVKTHKAFFSDMQSQAFQYQTLTARMNVNLNLPGNSLSSRVDLKMVKDSAFQFSVQPFLGIEIFRAEISLDSVKILDRMNKRYVAENYANLKGQTPIEFNFYNLQALFTNQLFIPGKQEVLPKQYGKFKLKQEGSHAEIQIKDAMSILYTFLVNGEGKINRTSLSEPSNRYILQWDYVDFRETDDQLFPMKMDVQIWKDGASQGGATLAFSRMQVDGSVRMDFSIPSSYRRITLSQILKSLSNKK